MIGGRYSLEREVGRGGMGAVWLGRDEVLGRVVAVKRIGLMPGGSTPDLERAAREAKLAASVNHPHIVAVYDLVHEGEQQWLVMEYVPGSDLRTHVEVNGPLDPDAAASIVAQAARALAAAHRVGIVHRDVKPSNILLDDAGAVKLTDFGIARAEQDVQLTQTGLVTGSPAYLAPEIASGRLATAQADVWSLGATLFHALEGRPPYATKDNVLATLYEIVNDAPPRPQGAGWLEPLIEGTLTKEPEDRWSMEQVRAFAAKEAPAPAPRASQSPAPPPTASQATSPLMTPPVTAGSEPAEPTAVDVGPPARRRLDPRLLMVAAAVLVLLLVAGWWSTRSDDPPPSGSQATSVPTPTDSPPTTTATPTPSASESSQEPPEVPPAAAMESFVASYLQSVVRDPDRSFSMLTKGFQRASGGRRNYVAFWREYAGAQLLAIQADPDAGTVSYTVKYTKTGGGGYVDDVRLRLQPRGETFLIAAEG